MKIHRKPHHLPFTISTMRLAFVLLVASTLLLPLSVAEEQTATYTAFNPRFSWAPDCQVPLEEPPGSLGLGGACFDVPADATRFEVWIEDLVSGPAYGYLNLCGEDDHGFECDVYEICAGHASGDIPQGATRAGVAAVYGAYTHCGLESVTWVPTRGTITLTFT